MALSPFFTHQVIHERTDGPASGLLERLDPGQARSRSRSLSNADEMIGSASSAGPPLGTRSPSLGTSGSLSTATPSLFAEPTPLPPVRAWSATGPASACTHTDVAPPPWTASSCRRRTFLSMRSLQSLRACNRTWPCASRYFPVGMSRALRAGTGDSCTAAHLSAVPFTRVTHVGTLRSLCARSLPQLAVVGSQDHSPLLVLGACLPRVAPNVLLNKRDVRVAASTCGAVWKDAADHHCCDATTRSSRRWWPAWCARTRPLPSASSMSGSCLPCSNGPSRRNGLATTPRSFAPSALPRSHVLCRLHGRLQRGGRSCARHGCQGGGAFGPRRHRAAPAHYGTGSWVGALWSLAGRAPC